MELLNWPPFRGPNPHIPIVECYPKIEHVDVPIPPAPEVPPVSEAEIDEVVEYAGKLFTGEESTVVPRPVLFKPFPKPKPKGRLLKDVRCNYHVATVVSLTLLQADRLLHDSGDGGDDRWLSSDRWESGFGWMIEPIKFVLDYPLRAGCEVMVHPYRRVMIWPDQTAEHQCLSFGHILWCLAKEYERIYREHEHYGVWGHAMDDLYFEGLKVKEGNGHVLIGS